jgi:hypothetical protein
MPLLNLMNNWEADKQRASEITVIICIPNFEFWILDLTYPNACKVGKNIQQG